MRPWTHEFDHRVPLRNRSGHQRISPDVQTGCISCCSGDGKFGGPIWWNTPVDDDDVEAEASGQQLRSQWTQPVGPSFQHAMRHLCRDHQVNMYARHAILG